MSPTDWLIAFALWVVIVIRQEIMYRKIELSRQQVVDLLSTSDTWEPADCDGDDDSGENWKLN